MSVAERLSAVAAVASAIGGGCLFLAGVPPGWYGFEPGASYVFDPAIGSPLWIERVLVPALSVLGTGGLLAGIAAVVHREWGAGRLVRWAGTATVLGGIALTVGLSGPKLVGGPGVPVDPIPVLLGVAIAAWGGLLLLVGGPLLAYGLLGAGHRELGWVLFGVLPAAILASALLPGEVGELIAAFPWLVLGGVLGRELWSGARHKLRETTG